MNDYVNLSPEKKRHFSTVHEQCPNGRRANTGTTKKDNKSSYGYRYYKIMGIL